MTSRFRFAAALAIGLVAALAGCAKPPPAPPPPAPEVANYTLEAGDLIAVKVFSAPELDQEMTVRPDGRISFSPIGEFDAAGKTLGEVDSALTAALEKDFASPEVTVFMRKFVNWNVYVGGEVDKPGIIPLTGPLTSLMAIVQAGGFIDTAQKSNVVVLRKAAEGSGATVLTVDARRVIEGAQPDLVLAPYDVVYVPRSVISRVDIFVDQYIRRALPFTLIGGANYNYVNDHVQQNNSNFPFNTTNPNTQQPTIP
jgi:protein involved in polysaccharide export with SLBB domain